ncbi:MAG: helix-turn-helix transcriptional regulator [Salinigranum sp.]
MSSDVTAVFEVLCDHDELLGVLTDGPHTQRRLTDRTDASQSTVSRTLSRLRDLGVVSETDEGYELTLLGRFARRTYESALEEFERVYAAEEILRDLTADVPLDPSLLEDAEVTVSKPHAPDAPLSPLLDLTREATTLRAAAAMIHAGYLGTFDDRMEHGDLEAEFVVTDAVAERSRDEYADRDPIAPTTGRLDVYRTDVALPYSLMLVETPDDAYAAVVVRGSSGTQGTIVTSNPEAREWASERYRRIKSSADPWDPPA